MKLEYADKRASLIFAISDKTMPDASVNYGITRTQWDSFVGFTYGALRRKVPLDTLWNGMLDEIEEKLTIPRPAAIRNIIPNIAQVVLEVYGISPEYKGKINVDTLHRIRRHSPAVQFLERASF